MRPAGLQRRDRIDLGPLWAWLLVIVIGAVILTAWHFLKPTPIPPTPAERAGWHLQKAREHIEAAERALRERHTRPSAKEITA